MILDSHHERQSKAQTARAPSNLARRCRGLITFPWTCQLPAGRLFILASLLLLGLAGCRLPAPVKTFPPPVGITPAVPPLSTPLSGSENAFQLPQALYFLRQDDNALPQVWRLDDDGKSLTQLTSAVTSVRDYDVARDGRLAYVAGSLLVAGLPALDQQEVWYRAPEDQPGSFPHAPRWSPDGQTLAFAAGGIQLVQAGKMRLLYPDPADGSQHTFPYTWSPDGRWLLANQDLSQGSILLLIDVATSDAHPLSNTPLCCQAIWSPDSQGLFIANPYLQRGPSGLWWAGLSNQTVPLMLATAPDNTYNILGWPHVATDGVLSYAFANFPTQPPALFPFGLYTASMSDPSQRKALRMESFFLREVLWAPDGRRAVLALPASGTNSDFTSGPLVFITTGQQPAQPLIESGYNLKWGP